MSSVEAALAALKSAIEVLLSGLTYPAAWPGVPVVEFVDPSPDMVENTGAVVIPPGSITCTPDCLGPEFENRHRIPIQIYLENDNEASRVAVRDAIVKAIASLTTANQTLGGAVSDVNAISNDRDNLGAKGSQVTAAAIITLELIYYTTTPLA